MRCVYVYNAKLQCDIFFLRECLLDDFTQQSKRKNECLAPKQMSRVMMYQLFLSPFRNKTSYFGLSVIPCVSITRDNLASSIKYLLIRTLFLTISEKSLEHKTLKSRGLNAYKMSENWICFDVADEKQPQFGGTWHPV